MLSMKILLVVNFRGWAWDYKAQNLKRHLVEYGHHVSIIYMSDYFSDDGKTRIVFSSPDYTNYDAILFFSLILSPLFNETLDFNKSFIGVCSHLKYNGDLANPNDIDLLNKFRGVFVVNNFLFQQYSSSLRNVHLCPNGVDAKHFFPVRQIRKTGKLRIGWVGFPKHKSDKGFYEFVQPLAFNNSWHLVLATDTLGFRRYEQMPSFYNEIDLYICASKDEGTPNPCLEAAACGRPILTTFVGNMPEIIKPGINGYFIERSLTSIQELIDSLDNNRAKLIKMGEAIHSDIQDWDWRFMINNYLKMLNTLQG